jgi:hypothetical protein
MEYLGSAVSLGGERLRAEFGDVRKVLDLQIQHGQVKIGTFKILLGEDEEKWVIKRWSSSRGSYLFQLELEYKYFEKGMVAEGYDHQDHIAEPSDNVERIIFGDALQAPRDIDALLQECSFNPTSMLRNENATRHVLRRIAIERLRTPIVHTR